MSLHLVSLNLQFFLRRRRRRDQSHNISPVNTWTVSVSAVNSLAKCFMRRVPGRKARWPREDVCNLAARSLFSLENGGVVDQKESILGEMCWCKSWKHCTSATTTKLLTWTQHVALWMSVALSLLSSSCVLLLSHNVVVGCTRYFSSTAHDVVWHYCYRTTLDLVDASCC